LKFYIIMLYVFLLTAVIIECSPSSGVDQTNGAIMPDNIVSYSELKRQETL